MWLEDLGAEALARGDADLLLHQIEPGAHLGHAVLDLEPRVHLEEEELAVVAAGDELDGARADVAHARHDAQRGVEQRLPPRLARGACEEGRRRRASPR